MVQGIRSRALVVAFVLSLATIYVTTLAIVSRLEQMKTPAVIAGALTLVLTLLVPLLYFLLLVHPRGWPAERVNDFETPTVGI